MNKIDYSYTARELIDAFERDPGEPGKLSSSIIIQRNSNLWNSEQLGRFIEGILYDDPGQPMFILHDQNDPCVTMELADGLQRFSALYAFVRDRAKLPRHIAPIRGLVYEIDKNGKKILDENGRVKSRYEMVDISGKTFEQLPISFRDKILRHSFECKMISNYTNEDVARLMYNLNNGTSASVSQKTVMKMGIELGGKIKEIANNSLMNNRIVPNLSKSKRNNSEEIKCVLTSLMVFSGNSNSEITYSKLSNTNNINSYVSSLKTQWNDSQLFGIKEIFEDLDSLLPDDELCGKYLTAHTLPVLVMNYDKFCSIDDEVTREKYKEFLHYWFTEGVEKIHYRYLSKLDNKNIASKQNVDSRIEAMDMELDYFVGNITDDEMREFYEEYEELTREYYAAEKRELEEKQKQNDKEADMSLKNSQFVPSGNKAETEDTTVTVTNNTDDGVVGTSVDVYTGEIIDIDVRDKRNALDIIDDWDSDIDEVLSDDNEYSGNIPDASHVVGNQLYSQISF